jgi:multidrug efflux system outer membrane protein
MNRPLRTATLLAALTLAACVPAHRPAPPQAAVVAPERWREPPPPPGVVDARWWADFGDPALAAQVEAALARNTDLMVAAARVEEALAQTRLARASLLPQVDATVEGGRARSLGAAGASTSSSGQAGLQASWEVDLFGRLSRLREAARLGYRAAQAERDAMALSIAAATAQAYITLLSLDAQLRVTRETVQSRAEALRLASDQAAAGYTSQLERSQAEAEYESVLQAVPELETVIRRQENALRLLTGAPPGAVAGRAALATLTAPTPPGVLPSSLLRRRPDLAQAELELAAADATLAARRAEFLPSVQLSASLGRLYVDSLDYDPVTIWSVGGSVLAPLFSAGRLDAQVQQAAAQRDQAAWSYRGAALNAFGEVEDALTSVDRLGRQAAHAGNRERILQRSLEFAQDRYRAGYASYLEELDAQRSLYSTQLDVIVLHESQLNAVVDLYKATGGGWTAGEG